MRRIFYIFRTVYSITSLFLLSSLTFSLFVRGRGGKPKPGPGVITASQAEWEETAGGENGSRAPCKAKDLPVSERDTKTEGASEEDV